jgi:hypothetical protein
MFGELLCYSATSTVRSLNRFMVFSVTFPGLFDVLDIFHV